MKSKWHSLSIFSNQLHTTANQHTVSWFTIICQSIIILYVDQQTVCWWTYTPCISTDILLSWSTYYILIEIHHCMYVDQHIYVLITIQCHNQHTWYVWWSIYCMSNDGMTYYTFDRDTVQICFRSFIPSDLFHQLLHTPESIYTFSLKQLKSVNETDGNEMSQVLCPQLHKQWLYACLQLGQLYLTYVILLLCISSLFHVIQLSDHSIDKPSGIS